MKVLVVVDMQNDFIAGALGTAEAKAIVPAVVEKIRLWDGEIVATRDTHGEDYLSTQEGRNLPVPHCVKGTPGWEIESRVQAALAEKPAVSYVDKPAFGSAELGDLLAARNRETPLSELELVGLCTDICVISNAMILKSRLSEVPMTVDASCCAGVTPESHRNALQAMQVCQIRITGEA